MNAVEDPFEGYVSLAEYAPETGDDDFDMR